jgi:lipoyl(octanoyl) transferase
MDWLESKEYVEYPQALAEMEARVQAIHSAQAGEAVWLLEHPALYTAGTSAKDADLLEARFPVYQTGRGGEHTYHGPGQRVAYVMLDLKKRQAQPDIKHYVWSLEEWIIRALAHFDIIGERRDGRVGIWVVMPDGTEKKIAALGVRVRHWITFHGVAINLNPDLSHFGGIVPCGLSQYGVTSIHDVLGRDSVSMDDLDQALKNEWAAVFY